ncbi:MAG: hypothetical protein ABR915_19575 [Thermoguttaceae bacterium]
MATSSMLVSNIGRCESKMISSESVYNSRVANPPPVLNRHKASESQGGTLDKLS